LDLHVHCVFLSVPIDDYYTWAGCSWTSSSEYSKNCL